MEILVLFVLATAMVGLLSAWAGHDSRPGPYSPEEHFSELGLGWGPLRANVQPPNRRSSRVGAYLGGRTPRFLLGLLRMLGVAVSAVLLLIAPLTAWAQATPAAAYTVDEVRSKYVRQGYVVDSAITWWTADYVSTFRVTDPTNDRIVMVLVYPDSSAVEATRARAQALESSNTGRLVRGFGISAWIGNVALVQATAADLNRSYVAELGMPGSESDQGWYTAQLVDVDFLSALDRSTVNL